MKKTVAKHGTACGKVYLPLEWVGLEVEVSKASEKKLIGEKSLEDLVDMIVEKTINRVLNLALRFNPKKKFL